LCYAALWDFANYLVIISRFWKEVMFIWIVTHVWKLMLFNFMFWYLTKLIIIHRTAKLIFNKINILCKIHGQTFLISWPNSKLSESIPLLFSVGHDRMEWQIFWQRNFWRDDCHGGSLYSLQCCVYNLYDILSSDHTHTPSTTMIQSN
jgi:hypothetical protein